MNLKGLQLKKSINELADKSADNQIPKLNLIKNIISQSNTLFMKNNNKIIKNINLSKVINSSISPNTTQFAVQKYKKTEYPMNNNEKDLEAFTNSKGNLTPDSSSYIKLCENNANNINKRTKFSILSNFRQIRKSIDKIPDTIIAANQNNLKKDNEKSFKNKKDNKEVLNAHAAESSTKYLFSNLSEIKISYQQKAKNSKFGFDFPEEAERSFYKNNNISININNNINNKFEILNISKSAISDFSGRNSAYDSSFINNKSNSKINITNATIINTNNEISGLNKNNKNIKCRNSLTKRNSVVKENQERRRSSFCVGNFLVDLKNKTIINGNNDVDKIKNEFKININNLNDDAENNVVNTVSRNLSFNKAIEQQNSNKDDSFCDVNKSFNGFFAREKNSNLKTRFNFENEKEKSRNSISRNNLSTSPITRRIESNETFIKENKTKEKLIIEKNDKHKILVLTNNSSKINISPVNSITNYNIDINNNLKEELFDKRESIDLNKKFAEGKKENIARISISKIHIRNLRSANEQEFLNKSIDCFAKESNQQAKNKADKNAYSKTTTKYSILGELRRKSTNELKKQIKEIIKSNPIFVEKIEDRKSFPAEKNKQVIFKDNFEVKNIKSEISKIKEEKEKEAVIQGTAENMSYTPSKNNVAKKKDKNISLDRSLNFQSNKTEEIQNKENKQQDENFLQTKTKNNINTQFRGRPTIINLNFDQNENDLRNRVIEFNKIKTIKENNNKNMEKSDKIQTFENSSSSYVPITKRNSFKKSESNSNSSKKKSILNTQKQISVSKFSEAREQVNNSNISFGESEAKNENKEIKSELSPSKILAEENKFSALKLKVKFQECEDYSKTNNSYNLQDKIFVSNKNSNEIKKKIRNIFEVSKCGFQGANIPKTNQDNLVVTKNIFPNEKDSYFFAVFDGHGVNGHEVSGFLKDKLAENVKDFFYTKNISSKDFNLDLHIKEILMKTNEDISSELDSNILFSGSTCISVLFTPSKLICANIGDSRAVLARQSQEEWICFELSIDHKPTDKNEAFRIQNYGGRVEPFKDEKGNAIGPSRVWLQNEPIPGLAMTRAFGDQIAATVGVTAEPEIFEIDFCEDDKFIILASDGLWEFIESEEVVAIVSGFYQKKDYRGALDFLFKESSKRWMEKEKIIDDITIILVFLE